MGHVLRKKDDCHKNRKPLDTRREEDQEKRAAKDNTGQNSIGSWPQLQHHGGTGQRQDGVEKRLAALKASVKVRT